jgi:hypothetical protein
VVYNLRKICLILIFFLTLITRVSAEEFSSSKGCLEKDRTQEFQKCTSHDNFVKWNLFGDLLYWHMGEVGLIPNSTIDIATLSSLTHTIIPFHEIKNDLFLNNINFGWDFGFRVGTSCNNVGCDQWGFSLYYTRFKTQSQNHGSTQTLIGIPSGFTLTPALQFQLNWLFAGISWKASWNLIYNMFDFDLDHKYQVSRSLLLRPYIGIKGGWIHQKVDIHSGYPFTPVSPPPTVPAKERLKNNFWGVGPKAGLGSKWCFGAIRDHSFYFLGDIGGAFMWSHWHMADKLKITEAIHGQFKIKDRSAGSLMFQGLAGVEWNVKFNNQCSCFAISLSYEAQVWFDQLQLLNAYNGRLHSILTLQGGSFGFCFNY